MIRPANQNRYRMSACLAALFGVVFLAGLWIAQDAAGAPASTAGADMVAAIGVGDDAATLPELEGAERKGASAPQRLGYSGPDVALAPVWEALAFESCAAAHGTLGASVPQGGLFDRPSARDPPASA